MRTALICLFSLLFVATTASAEIVGKISTNKGRQKEILEKIESLDEKMDKLNKDIKASVNQIANTVNVMAAQVALMQQNMQMTQGAQINELKLMLEGIQTSDGTDNIAKQMEEETRRLEAQLEDFKKQALGNKASAEAPAEALDTDASATEDVQQLKEAVSDVLDGNADLEEVVPAEEN